MGGGALSRTKQGVWGISKALGRTAVHRGGSLPLGRGFCLALWVESFPSILIRTWLSLANSGTPDLPLLALILTRWSLDVGACWLPRCVTWVSVSAMHMHTRVPMPCGTCGTAVVGHTSLAALYACRSGLWFTSRMCWLCP